VRVGLEGNGVGAGRRGEGTNGWGSGCSAVVHGKLLLVNASVESGSLVALDKLTGSEVWRTKKINSSWNTPLLVGTPEEPELVVSIQDSVVSLNPDNGEELWRCEGGHRYCCPSVVSHENTIFAIGGGSTSLAVRLGGEVLWRTNKGSNVGSPVYHDGHLYWASDSGGFVCCQKADDGQTVYQERLEPRPGRIWSSPVLADGKL